MNVLLVSPPSRIINHYRPPLALMYLSGYLKHCGIESQIIDITFKSQVRNKSFCENKDHYLAEVEDEIIRRVGAADTDIVGITCYTPELLEVEKLAGRIKSIKKNVTIIAGGIHPTLYPRDFLNLTSSFDFVVIGEGEIIFANLVRAIRAGRDNYKDVKGIGYFDGKRRQAVVTDSQPLVDNLDEISFPDYEDLDMDFYTTPSPYAIRGVFTKSFYILSSRGCPSSCTFCVSKKLREHYFNQQFVRLRTPKSLFSEIQNLRDKYKIDSFYFIDDLFTLKKDSVYEFCDLMIKARSPLIWACSSKVNTVDYDMLRKMQKAGCVQIDFGVEKGSDEALKYLKKGITVERIKQAFNHCHKLGIRTFANMLVNTPGEKESDLQDSVNLVKEIKPEVVQFNIFAPYPGCEIYDACCKGFEKEDYPLLMNSALWITRMPEKFRFSVHSVNILEWATKANKKYNRILPNLAVHLKPRYLRNFLHSAKKMDYLKQVASLSNEFINQKF